MMIENAYFSINPPTDQSLENRPKKSPMEEYVCKLIYLDLCKTKTEKVCSIDKTQKRVTLSPLTICNFLF